MAADLSKARRQGSQVRSLMRQGKYIPALQALYDILQVIIKTPLMKTEKEEFERLVTDGTYHIMADPTLRRAAALQIAYTPGQEKSLMESLRMLMEVLEQALTDDAEKNLRESEEKRHQKIDDAQKLLDNDKLDAARTSFRAIADDRKEDGPLMVDIGTRFLKAGLYADAAEYLSNSLHMVDPDILIYNQLAMAQRKLGMFKEAEATYMLAARIDTQSPHLFFNLGRLYIDWKRFDVAIKAAKRALELDPEFIEAQKLLNYAEKGLQNS